MAEIKWVSLALQPPVTTRITHPSLYISSLVNSWSLDASHRKSWKAPPTSNVNQAMTILKSFRSSLQTNVIVYNTIISAHEKGAREGDSVVAGDVVGTADIINAKMQPGMRTSRIDDVYHWATFNINSCDTQLLNEAFPFFPTIQGDPTVADCKMFHPPIMASWRWAMATGYSDLREAPRRWPSAGLSSVYHHASCR